MIAVFAEGIMRNMEDHSKDLQIAKTQNMLTTRKSYP